jgi:nitrous oxide reductase accessory protein NosL
MQRYLVLVVAISLLAAGCRDDDAGVGTPVTNTASMAMDDTGGMDRYLGDPSATPAEDVTRG